MSEAASPLMEESNDIRPVVPLSRASNAGLWAFGIALLLGGYLMFSMLSDRRAEISAPRTAAIPGSEAGMISSPPPLAVPGDASSPYGYDRYAYGRYAEPAQRIPPVMLQPVRPTPAPARLVTPVQPAPQQPAYKPPQVREIAPAPGFEIPRSLPDLSASAPPSTDRIGAGRLANPALTVPQGTVIPAVLETALDSTRPGAARALVQRNVYGFDGTRVLIPRGSRLYGEYEADLGSGQKRAAVRWTRLLRPDGVTVSLDSPASDPLGRAGIKGKVDSKFFQRFGGALLQSVLDVGVGLAASRATDGVIVALPGSTQNVQVSDAQQAKPTLSVRQGTSVSVFVARDLDFSSVGG